LVFTGLPLASRLKTGVFSATETDGKLKDGSRGAGKEHYRGGRASGKEDCGFFALLVFKSLPFPAATSILLLSVYRY
jgi:hypothetical protein